MNHILILMVREKEDQSSKFQQSLIAKFLFAKSSAILFKGDIFNYLILCLVQFFKIKVNPKFVALADEYSNVSNLRLLHSF